MMERRWVPILIGIVLLAVLLLVWSGIMREQRRSEDYATGLAAEEAGEWQDAQDVWARLGGYKDSAERMRAARCREFLTAAQAAYDEGRYVFAKDLLLRLGPLTEELQAEVDRLRASAEAAAEEHQDRVRRERAAKGLEAAKKAYRERKWAEAISEFEWAARDPEVAREINVAHQRRAKAQLEIQRKRERAALTRKVVTCAICGKVTTGAKSLEEYKTNRSLILVKSSGLCSARCRKADRLKKDHPFWNKNDCYSIAGGKVRTGMTAEQARLAWGRPRDINRTTSAFGVREQWCYSSGNYLYFESGILTTIQN